MLKRFSLLAAATLLGVSGFAAGIELQKDGSIKIDGDAAALALKHYGENWVPTGQSERGSYKPAVEQSGDLTRFSGVWTLAAGGSADCGIKAKRVEGGYDLSWKLSAATPVPSRALSLELKLPAWSTFGKPVRIGDEEFLFPEEPGKDSTVVSRDGVRRMEFPLQTGRLILEPGEPVSMLLADFRVFNSADFAARILLPIGKDVFSESALTMRMRFIPYEVKPLDIRRQVNMGFRDEVAEDGEGGWTDQGPTNDLSAMKPGKIAIAPVTFDVIDPANNNGKSCIVLGGGGRPYFPRKVTLPADGGKVRTVFLLHAVAWPPAGGEPAGTVTAVYKDGSRYSTPVESGRDVANWWQPVQLPNGQIAWLGSSEESAVGLYSSSFEIPDKPLAALEFESSGKAVWMIVAVSASAQRVPIAQPMQFRFVRTDDWKPFSTDRSIVAGSALDFSFLLDAPAGKYGFLQVKNGKFVFEKQDKPVRFYGANLCFRANYLSREQADLLAERLSRIGYNAIRFHHYDRDIVKQLPANSTTADPENLDKLDYLVYALKQRGIYITTDLYTIRTRKPGEFKSIPELEEMNDYKLAAMLLPEVRENLKTFARLLFTHRNPYTGLTWAEDPVFIGISLLNENTILSLGTGCTGPIREAYDAYFEKWCAAKGLKPSEQERPTVYRRFLCEVYDEYYKDMTGFLRSLGVRAPFTDQNNVSSPNLAPQRAMYDYVDNHLYWDHPQFIAKAWSLPSQLRNESVLLSRLRSPKELAPTRVFGKPFTVTEFDFCFPNEFRGEGAPIFGAYAALQDWDGVYRFAYSHSDVNMFTATSLETFDVVNDPVRLLTERIGMVFFTRGDVKPAEAAFPVAVSKENTSSFVYAFPVGSQELMFFGRTGTVLFDGNRLLQPLPAGSLACFVGATPLSGCAVPQLTATKGPEMIAQLLEKGVIPANAASKDGNRVQSLTGELSADFKAATFRAVTPRSEALILPQGATLAGNFLSARTVRDFATVAAIAVDDRPLAESGRILILHVTDVRNEGIKYGSKERKVILENDMKGQLLARRGVVDFTARVGGEGWKLFALDFNGKRIGEVPFTAGEKGISFQSDTFRGNAVVFAYELVRQ